jgi:hypothetical protein
MSVEYKCDKCGERALPKYSFILSRKIYTPEGIKTMKPCEIVRIEDIDHTYVYLENIAISVDYHKGHGENNHMCKKCLASVLLEEGYENS